MEVHMGERRAPGLEMKENSERTRHVAACDKETSRDLSLFRFLSGMMRL